MDAQLAPLVRPKFSGHEIIFSYIISGSVQPYQGLGIREIKGLAHFEV
jgi:hypothetical protein